MILTLIMITSQRLLNFMSLRQRIYIYIFIFHFMLGQPEVKSRVEENRRRKVQHILNNSMKLSGFYLSYNFFDEDDKDEVALTNQGGLR